MSSASLGYAYGLGPRPEIPPILDVSKLTDGAHATDCRLFLNHQISYNTTKRVELERAWNRARLYDANQQWLRPYTAWGGNRYWFTWEPMKVTGHRDNFPRPKRNMFSPGMQDETARLIGVGSKPYIRVDDDEAEENGLLGKRVLLYRNEVTGWDRQNRLGCYHMPMFGQWIQGIRWMQDRMRTVRHPRTDMLKSPSANVVFADRFVQDREHIQAIRLRPFGQDALQPVFDDAEGRQRYEIKCCPETGEELQPFEPPRQVWEGGVDTLRRPLAQEIPIGDDETETISPYSFFPQNQGIGYQFDTDMEEWVFRTPRSIQWIRDHFQNTEGITPERGDIEMFRHHPFKLGRFGLATQYEGVWDNHVMLDEYYHRPCSEFPRGRAIVMCGQRLLLDDELYVAGTEIPRCDVRVAQWEIVENEIWGKSLAEDLFSVQDNLNSTLSQAMDIRQKWTSPKVFLHEGQHLTFAGGANAPYSGDIWTINTRGLPPQINDRYPYVFGNTGSPGSVWQEMDRDRDYVQEATGARAAEIGNVSGVEFNYSALLFAAQKSAERRRPRIDGIRALKRGIWKTRLQMIAGLYREERLYRFMDENDRQQVDRFRGLQLKNQTEVALEEEPVVDAGTAKRAAISQGIEWRTILTSAEGGEFRTDRQINREIGVPESLNEEQNIQLDRAQREWDHFWEKDEQPAVDVSSDLHKLHYHQDIQNVYGRRGREYQSKIIEESGGKITWPRILRLAWDWEQLLGDLGNREMMIRQAPPPNKLFFELQNQGATPEEAEERVLELAGNIQKAKQDLYSGPFPFPADLEGRIYSVWGRLLMANGVPLDQLRTLKKLVRYNAHRLAHWKLMMAEQAPMMAPAPGPGAPAAAGPVGPGGPGPAPPGAEAPAA